MTPTTLPTEGSIELRVRYCECDPMGVAHHGSYAAWLEIGRTELLRQSGVTYTDLEAQDMFLAIVKLAVRFKKAVRYDDVLTVVTRIEEASRVKLVHHYEIRRGGRSGELLTTAATTLACIDRTGRLQPLPDWMHQLDARTPARRAST
ncbi:MAG: acyl-CoA thioesterase [Phycisphaerales bacterium]|nr:acyl-CoA thioesterase [Phycisphaerales bacterium]